MWLWLRQCVCACTNLYTSVAVCYFWEPCLLLTFKPTGNGKWFATLKLKLRSDSFQASFLVAHCDRLSSIWRKYSLQQQITDNFTCAAAHFSHLRHTLTLSSSREELWISVDWPHTMFSLQACRGELLCYFPFHTSIRGQTRTPHREAFVLRMHSTSGMGNTPEDYLWEGFLLDSEQFRNRVRRTWFKLIKTLRVLSKS